MTHAVLDLSITQNGLRLLVLMNQPCKYWHCSGLFPRMANFQEEVACAVACVEARGQPEQLVSSFFHCVSLRSSDLVANIYLNL